MLKLCAEAGSIFCGAGLPFAVKSKAECIFLQLFRRREQVMHGTQISFQSEIRFRQILCLDDSMVLIYCLCAQQMGLGKQLDTDGAGQGEKQDRYDHFH